MRFNGKYVFLSNFCPVFITIDRIKYPTVEHAYQAAKTLNRLEKLMIASLASPGRAKRVGRKLNLHSNWDEVKVGVMLQLVRLKFTDPSLRAELLMTGDMELVEDNIWGDVFWGMCRGKGQNQLGKILMKVREECRAQ